MHALNDFLTTDYGLMSLAVILFVVVMGALLAVTVSVQDGVKNLPPVYARAARTMGVRPLALYTEVLLPASLPAILTGAKLENADLSGASMTGSRIFLPSSSDDGSIDDTSRSTRGLKAIESSARRLRRSVVSVSVAPTR